MSDTNTASNVIQSIAGTVGSAFVIYISVTIRKGVKKFMGEHDWLMNQTRDNTEAIAKNQQNIAKILEIQEARIARARRQTGGQNRR